MKKMMVHAMDLMDCRHQTSLMICVILVVVFPVLVATNTDKHEYGNTYERKTEGNREFSKNTKQSKHDETNEDSMSQMKHPEDQPGRINNENGSPLSRFLENVLKAQNDLKWIDQVVHSADQKKILDKSSPVGSNKYPELPNFDTASQESKKVRDKRSFVWKTNKRKYQGLPPSPQRVYLDSDTPFERNSDLDDLDTFQNGINGQESDDYKSGKPSNEKDTTNDQLPKEWANSKDICSLDDWFDSNKNFKMGQDKREDRSDSRVNVRNQRDGTEKTDSSLEALKETILELKKSLNEDEKKERETKMKEKDVAKERNTRAKNKHRKHEKDKDSSWQESLELEASEPKKREDVDDLNEQNVHRKSWRRKRTEVNNDDDSSRKLFHRAGFGESYLEEKALKELHDRKRRSKETLSDEKHHTDEPCEKNKPLTDEKDVAKESKETGGNDVNDFGKKASNDLQTNDGCEQDNKAASNPEDNTILKSRNEDVGGNYEHGNYIDNKLTKNDEKGDSGGIFESIGKFFGKTSTLSTNDGVKDEEARMQQGKAFEPEEHLVAKTDERIEEPSEDHGKSVEQSQEKRDAKDSENINILVKSENKNLIKFSNGAGKEDSGFKGEQPYVLNRFDLKKKLIVENEGKSGKSVATMFNVKIEKAQVDAPMKDNKRERTEKEVSFEPLNFGRNKVDELYENKHELTNDIRQKNIDEKGIQDSVEINKGSTESSGQEGTQNWYKNQNQININDQNTIEKDHVGNKEEKLTDNDKMKEDSNDRNLNPVNLEDQSHTDDHEGKNKRKNTQIVIVPDGMDDRKLTDMYSQRRILQYMEYSNDDVEDADASFSDKEEENQKQATADKSSASSGRKERAALRDKTKAKVNVMIKEKLDQKKKKYRDTSRTRRNPVSVIEYYDYDSDNEQREHEAGEQERIKTNYDKNPVESDEGLAKEGTKRTSSTPPIKKKDEQEEEMLKQEKQKQKHPKQEFILHEALPQPGNVTEKTEQQESLSMNEDGSSLRKEQELPRRLDQSEDNVNDINRGRLNEPIAEREDKFLGDGSKDSGTYIFSVEKPLDPEMIDDFLDDVESIDRKNEKTSNFEPLYEELKKIYDWSQDETQIKPRIKGDHRMYYGANDKLDPTNKMSESYEGQLEFPEIKASSPNLMPLLLHHDGSSVGTKTCSTEFDDRSAANASRNNYLALKSTDDMFKGGSEQSNFTEGEKLRENGPIGMLVEWTKQKVNGLNNEPNLEKDAGSWSLTGRERYIDTDSRSPYENRKYLELPLATERVQNVLDPEKEMVISSKDLHESFVDPLDQIDDLDEDIRLRLGRSLKTIDQEKANKIVQVDPEVTKVGDGGKGTSTLITEQNLLNVSTIQDSTMKTTSRSDDSRLGFLRYPPLDLQELFNANGNRVKRQIRLPYDAFYDDINQPRDDSERLNYYGYSKNGDAERSSMSKSDDEEADDENYEKVVRRASSKKSKKHKKRKKKHSKKKKSHTKKSKTSRRKRRHPKKHSNDSKMKSHEHRHNKHKKRTSKTDYRHSDVKKNKNDEKTRRDSSVNNGKTRREKMDKEHATNTDSDAQRKKFSSLLTIDNVEDDSQMDSALQGELAGKIVEHIFDQVQKNEDLKVSLGPGLYQKHKTRDTMSADKSYRQALNNDEVNHTTKLLNKIMLLLNRLIFDEVQRKTCVTLSPDLTEFLDWMLDVNPKRNSMEQRPSLPLVHPTDVPRHFPKDKFLFQNSPGEEMKTELNELRERLLLVEKLINEYRELSDNEKGKVQSVHDYLSKQLDLLLQYVESKKKENSTTPTGAAKGGHGMILQYQGGPQKNSISDLKGPNMISSSMNVSSFLKLKNSKYLPGDEYFHENGLDFFHKGRRTIRSLEKRRPHKKHRKRIKHKKKHHKRHKDDKAIDHRSHKDAKLKAKTSRQKREYLDKEFRNSFDSEYEEPVIYSSMDFETLESRKREDTAKGCFAPKEEHSTLIGKTVDNRKNKIDSEISQSNEEVRKREVSKINDLSTSAEKKNSEREELKDKTMKTKIETDVSMALADLQSSKSDKFNEKQNTDPTFEDEEPITGKDQLEDEILLLNKRQSWKKKNEEQLEEVAFGEDMRKGLKEKELFEKLTEIDKNKVSSKNARTKKQALSFSLRDCTKNDRNNSCNLSDEDKLRMLKQKINVYPDE